MITINHAYETAVKKLFADKNHELEKVMATKKSYIFCARADEYETIGSYGIIVSKKTGVATTFIFSPSVIDALFKDAELIAQKTDPDWMF